MVRLVRLISRLLRLLHAALLKLKLAENMVMLLVCSYRKTDLLKQSTSHSVTNVNYSKIRKIAL